MFRQTFKIIKAFGSSEKPWQISLGLIFGAIMGLTPLASPHNLAVLILALILDINFGMVIVGWGFFSGIAYVLDPVLHQIGYGLLTAESLQPFWNRFFTCPIFVVSNLNNTLVLGSLAFSLTASVPLFFIFNSLLVKYREQLNGLMSRIPLLKSLRFLKSWETMTGD